MSVERTESYAGKRVAIAGCSSGMGEACARALVARGAEVHGVDVRPSLVEMASFAIVDLRDWGAIERSVAGVAGELDLVFNCAGVPSTLPAADVLAINFLGVRHWTEQWLPRMRTGGAIATISSLAGMRYLTRLDTVKEAIAIRDKVEFLTWASDRAETLGDSYSFSKELLNAWTQMLAVELAPRGIRANATMPSPTETPLIATFEKLAGEARLALFCQPTGRRSTAEEQADALLMLNSDAARFVSGVCLPVDGGYFGGSQVGAIGTAPIYKAK